MTSFGASPGTSRENLKAWLARHPDDAPTLHQNSGRRSDAVAAAQAIDGRLIGELPRFRHTTSKIEPAQDEAPPVTGPEDYGLPADREPVHEPTAGATAGKAPDIQPFETFDASQWQGRADRAAALDCT